MKNKRILGPLLGVLFVLIIIILGYFIGKYVASEYNKKHQTNKTIFEILKIENKNEPINYVLQNKTKTLSDLCGKNTGICDQEVGVISLDKREVHLYIYANFDNPDDLPTTYFKLDNKKVGSFVYLDKFEIFANKYLIITEPNSYNDNYIIHIYDNTGREIAGYEATKLSTGYEIKNDELYYNYCNSADSGEVDGETVPRVSYFKVTSSDITKKEEVSFEYKKCA